MKKRAPRTLEGTLLPAHPLVSFVDHDRKPGEETGAFLRTILRSWYESYQLCQCKLTADDLLQRLRNAASAYWDLDVQRFRPVRRSRIEKILADVQNAVDQILLIIDVPAAATMNDERDTTDPAIGDEDEDDAEIRGLASEDIARGLYLLRLKRSPYPQRFDTSALADTVMSLRVLRKATNDRLQIEVEPASGAPTKEDIYRLVAAIADIWSACAGRRFPKSVETDDRQTAFTSASAHAIYTVARAIDDRIELASVRTGIRRLRSAKNTSASM